MAEEVRLDLVANDKASKDIKKVTSGTKEATTQTTLLGGAMNMVRGAMLKVKTVSKLLFGSIKAGLISTGIGAFVVVVGSLVSYFTKTKKGAELLEQAFAGIGAAISVLTDRISKIGGAIAKVFSGDFKGAAEDVKGALSGISDEIIEESKAAARLKKELQDVKDATRGFNIEKAKTNQEIAKALLLAEDETKSNEVRLQALKDALALEQETTAKELELQRRRVAAVEEEVGLGESLEEDLERLNQAKIRLIELETASIKQRKKVVTQVNDFEKSINSERLAREKEEAKAKEEADKVKADAEKVIADKKIADDKIESDRLAKQEEDRETAKDLIVNKFKLEREQTELQAIETEKQKQLAELERLNATEEQKASVREFFAQKTLDVLTEQADKEKALEKAKVQATIDTNNETLAAVGGLAGSLGKLAGDSKGLAVAEATISTYLGATKALAAGAGTPIGYINAAAIIATGLANVKTILSTDVGDGGGGSVPSGVSSVGGNIAASIPAATGLGDVVDSINGQANQPVEAFVIAQNVTDSQEAQSYINNQRTL